MRLRIVLDTNIVISALFFGGPPGDLLRLALEGEVELVTSSHLVAEVERVLRSKFPHAQQAIWDTLAILNEMATHAIPREEVSVIHKDPADNRVLECAISAHVDAIISGDRHLLTLKQFRGIPILSPRAFLQQFEIT